MKAVQDEAVLDNWLTPESAAAFANAVIPRTCTSEMPTTFGCNCRTLVIELASHRSAIAIRSESGWLPTCVFEDHSIITVEPGKRADFVSLDLEDISLQPPNRLLKNIVYAMSPQAIRGVWVDGKQRLRDDELTGWLSLREISARVQVLTEQW